MPIIQQFTNSPLRNFQYIIWDRLSKEAICVDPYDVDLIHSTFEKNNLTLKAIFNTHEHKDHTHGNELLAPLAKEGVWTHALALQTVPHASRAIIHQERIQLDGMILEFIHTPGHTPSSITLLGRIEKEILFLITGDTIFNAGVGNCYRGGDPSILYETIAKIYNTFPGSTKVYPGHDYLENNIKFTLSIMPQNQAAIDILYEYKELSKRGEYLQSNLGLERKLSTFFQLNHPDIRKKFNDSNLRRTEKEIFLELRKLRDTF
ncbi:MAG: hydroxyacylglutathione hydrolase family protein [Leptospiraceae bacterium]|nr:hydroxyacylglutathione hydrolase family protein [Leptospiraceae bacterium]